MSDTVENLILDLLEWVARSEHTYHETFDAWRTSCPRLPVWEEATVAGLHLLKERRPQPCADLRKARAPAGS
jgi:hypothetical protein